MSNLPQSLPESASSPPRTRRCYTKCEKPSVPESLTGSDTRLVERRSLFIGFFQLSAVFFEILFASFP